MWVLCFLLLAVRVNSVPQEPEVTTWPPVDEAIAIDNDVLEALEQELIRNNITLTREVEIPKNITQVADHYARVQNSLSRPQAALPSFRKGILKDILKGNSQGTAIAAYGAGSIVTLAKVALVMIALNSGLREATVIMGTGVTGTLKLRQEAAPFGPTVITGTLKGLTAGEHGFHIHEFGNLTDGCTSTGAHYNPFGATHGAPTNATRHVGDLGNILALNNGTAFVNITDSQVLLVGPTSVLGRAVVVHQLKDDLGLGGHATSSTTGNTGARVGCGVIGGA